MILIYILKKVEKRDTQIETENSGFNLAGFDQFKSEILAELRSFKKKDLEDMFYRIELISDEIVDILDVKNIAGLTNGYTLFPGKNGITDNSLLLISILPNKVKVNTTIDNIRLRSNVTTYKTIR